MPRASATELAVEIRDRHRDPKQRRIEIALDIVGKNGAPIIAVGGLWDRVDREFVGDAEAVREIHCHPGQVPAVEWFDAWLEDHLAGLEKPADERVYSALFSGGQRAGKTWIAVTLAVAYTISRPGSIVWLVAPTEPDFIEFETLLAEIMPPAWYRKVGDEWTLVTGARIVMRSAHQPGSLKKGRADLVVMNECQLIEEEAFGICRARIADRSGIVIGCANPPQRPIGEWVADWAAETDAGSRASKHFYFSPFDNPHVDHEALRAMQSEIDHRSYEVDVLGKILSIGDTVLWNWDRRVNEVTVADLARRLGVKTLRDITPEVTARLEGQGFRRVLGIDVQRRPMVAVEFRFFENPLAPVSRYDHDTEWVDHCFAFIVSEVVLEGDEDDLMLACKEAGWNPAETLIVCDASARWQFSYRDSKTVQELRDRVKGKGSWDVFRQHGFRHIVAPDRDMARNPEVIERCRATCARIATATSGRYGRNFLFADPACTATTRAIRKWPNDPRGNPSRTSQHAHLGDCVTYVGQRFFARRYTAASLKTVTEPRKPPPNRDWLGGEPWAQKGTERAKRRQRIARGGY